jgi:hypothetical protein
MGLFGDLESGGSSAGAGGSESGSAGVGGSKAGGAGVDSSRTWTRGNIRPYQVRCTVPAVQKVTVTSAGKTVNYKSLSVRGVQFKGQTGNGPIGNGQRTRRNSI